MYVRGQVPLYTPASGNTKMQVVVEQGDCLVTAKDLQTQGHERVAVLNMACATHPGGGYLQGQGAQEENLHRRSTYSAVMGGPMLKSHAQMDRFYPISEKAIYSPGVFVFRGGEEDGYALMESPFYVDMIAVPAVAHPTLSHERDQTTGEPWMVSQRDVDETRQRIRIILQVAALHQVDGLVLSALGCGAFCCPPTQVARLFKEELDRFYMPPFRTVVFAIREDHNSKMTHNPHGNAIPFANVFGVKVKKQFEH